MSSRPFFQPVTYLGIGVTVLIVATLYYLVAKDRDDAYQAAIKNGDNITRLFEGYVSRSIESADLTLLFLRKLYEQSPASFKLAEAVNNHFIHQELTVQFTVANADGYVTDSSWSNSANGAYRGDEEGFRVHAAQQADQLFISAPLRLKSSGRWGIVLSRRLSAPDGTFAGVIVALVDPYQLQNFNARLDFGSDGVISLLGLNGTVIATNQVEGRPSAMYGRTIPAARIARMQAEGPVGHFWSRMPMRDSVSRLISFRRIEALPLFAVVGVSENQIFKDSDSRAHIYFGIGAVMLLAVLGVIAWGTLRERRLRQTNMLLEQALAHMPHGICMFGADKRIRISNSLYATMYGLSPEQTKPGTTLLEILKARIALGSCPKDSEKYIVDRLDEAFRPEPGYIVNELLDGRVVGISRRSMPDGGSVAIHQDITEQKRNEEKIVHLAHYDGLTGLANRNRFLEHVGKAADDYRKQGTRFAVHLMDLDRFKEVNDSLGHAIGDALLVQVAERLTASLGPNVIVARLGGDEFTVLQVLSGDGTEDAGALARRILTIIAPPADVEGNTITIETSIGVSLAPEHGLDFDELLKRADLALYRAKSEGRNGWRVFEPDMEQEARKRLALAMDLRHAVAQQQFELHYQPIVSATTEQYIGAEALVRWRHPTRGLVPPGDFIGLAEETGLIVALGEWALRNACNCAAGWPSSTKVAVNLSPVQFRAGNLVPLVQSALAEAQMPASRLELEITESVLLGDNEDNLRMLHELKALGVGIVLDDFGTGYASMSYLLRFPFDKIKIDRKFVADMPTRTDCAAIVAAVAGLARNLNIAVTAEGVETRHHLTLVRAAGCGFVQGFLFSRPVPASELEFGQARQPLLTAS